MSAFRIRVKCSIYIFKEGEDYVLSDFSIVFIFLISFPVGIYMLIYLFFKDYTHTFPFWYLPN